jgi:hypothetical protein
MATAAAAAIGAGASQVTQMMEALVAVQGINTATATISQLLSRIDAGFLSYHISFEVAKEFTDMVDVLLTDSSHGIMKSVILPNQTPGLGYHYWYPIDAKKRALCSQCYVTLKKNKMTNQNGEEYYYTGYISPRSWGKEALESMTKRLLATTKSEIVVGNIVMKPWGASLVRSKHSLSPDDKDGKLMQRSIMQNKGIEYIMGKFFESQVDNVQNSSQEEIINNCILNNKVIICGEPNIGKSHMGYLIKQKLDRETKTKAILIPSFDPSMNNVNIIDLILSRGSLHTPVIIVLNELDKVLNKIIEGKNYKPGVYSHARDVNTWNDLMDTIHRTKYVFFVATTNKTPQELYNMCNETNNARMIRKNRFDFYLHMYKNDGVAKVDKIEIGDKGPIC